MKSIGNWKVEDFRADSIVSTKTAHAWLLVWNVSHWEWKGYQEKCARTKRGETFVESWSCASTKPKQGDEAFLIKLGAQPRGIIGHGRVVRESFIKDVYDPGKPEPKKEKHIDVEFDWLQDYQTDKLISQSTLQQECPDQHWSPQNSGIEIKPQILPRLKELWQELVYPQTATWRPSLEEYNPGITADEYKIIIRPRSGRFFTCGQSPLFLADTSNV